MAYTIKGVAGQNYNKLSAEEQARVQAAGDALRQKNLSAIQSTWNPQYVSEYTAGTERSAEEAAQREAESIFTNKSNAMMQKQVADAIAGGGYGSVTRGDANTIPSIEAQGQKTLLGMQPNTPEAQANIKNLGTHNTSIEANKNVPPIANQMSAISQPPSPTNQPNQGTNSTTGGNTGVSQTDYEAQYKALLGDTSGVDNAQAAIDAKNNSLTQGKFNVSQQPIADSFISGQQAAMQTQSDIAKVPLQQQLANAQAKRQAALDSARFSLEREDKKTESATAKEKSDRDEAFRQAQLAETKRANMADERVANFKSGATPSITSTNTLGSYPEDIQAAAQSILDGKSKLNEYPSAKRLQINEAMSKVYTAEGGNELAQGAYDSIVALEKHSGFGGAIGAKGFSSLFGLKGKPMEGTAAAGFLKELDKLKANIKLVNIKYLKGTGALSDAEGATLENAGTSLDPALPEGDFTKELARVKAALLKANNVTQTGAVSSDGTALQSSGITPSGIKYTVTP